MPAPPERTRSPHEHDYLARLYLGREIRSEIQSSLAMTSGKDLDWQKLIASAEWAGKKMEEEIDNAQRDKVRDQERQSEGRNRKP